MDYEKVLKEKGYDYQIIPFSGPTVTHEDVKKNCLVDIDLDSDCKTIIISDKLSLKYYALFLESKSKLNMKRVKNVTETSSKISVLDKGKLFEIFNCFPGQVCPLLLKDIPLYVDKNVLKHEKVHFGSGKQNLGLQMKVKDLLNLIENKVVDLTSEMEENPTQLQLFTGKDIILVETTEETTIGELAKELKIEKLYYMGNELPKNKKVKECGLSLNSPIELEEDNHISRVLFRFLLLDDEKQEFSNLTDYEFKYFKAMTNEMSLPWRFEEKKLIIFRKYHKEIRKGMTEIIKDLIYLGSIRDAKDHDYLKKHGIKRILNVTTHKGHDHEGIRSKSIPVLDVRTFKIFNVFDECYDFIIDSVKNSEPILIHCVVGRSRSATITLGFLMKYQQKSLEESYHFVKNKRDIRPNDGFMRELMEFEKSLFNIERPSLQWKFKNFDKTKVKQFELDISSILDEKYLLETVKNSVNKFTKQDLSEYMKFMHDELDKFEDQPKHFKKEAIKYISKWYLKQIN